VPETKTLRSVVAPLLVLACLAGCASRSYQPSPAVDPPRRPSPPPPTRAQPSALRLLDEADRLYLAGDLQGAADRCEAVIASGQPDGLDRALFRLAMIHFEAAGPLPDATRGRSLLERLLQLESPGLYTAPARQLLAAIRRVGEAERRASASEATVASLRAEVRRLEGQLEALKRIDLGTPRRDPPMRTRKDGLPNPRR